MKNRPEARIYRQTERAEAAEETARQIRSAFSELVRMKWFDEITLEEVAEKAGVTARTVIRRFGGKDGLLEAFVNDFIPSIAIQRETPTGNIDAAIDHLVEIYETWGDSVIRNLAQEPRHPALKRLLDHGRERHRSITAKTYSPWLDGLSEAEKAEKLDRLVAVTDVYVWKLARRDMQRSRVETATLLRSLVQAILAQPLSNHRSGGSDD